MLIYQLTNTTAYQMMGYVIKMDNGKIIVIDGGNHGQSDELYRVLSEVGRNIELWILTHEHKDHFGSIIDLFREHNDIYVKNFMYNPCRAKLEGVVKESEQSEVREWNEFVKEINLKYNSFKMQQVIEIDGLKIECLGTDNPQFQKNVINNQSIVLKFTEDNFSIIFLGDLGIEGGRKLLENAGDKIRCDAVQMAHHGQNGVEREVYEKMGAKYAFWPTPKWLWENTPYLGGNPGEGPFQTPEVIKWMKELDCVNITSFCETTVFDTKKKILYNKS